MDPHVNLHILFNTMIQYRVAMPGSGSVDIVLEETLSKAMDCWAGFNQQVNKNYILTRVQW